MKSCALKSCAPMSGAPKRLRTATSMLESALTNHSSEPGPTPLVEALDSSLEAVDAWERLRGLPHCLFLDSALPDPRLGRYSFVCADPFAWRTQAAGRDGGLAELGEMLKRFRSATVPGLPPFQGGLGLMLGYDLNRSLERMPAPRYDDLPTPALAAGFYDVALAFDHQSRQGWLISHGHPATDETARRARAATRLKQFRNHLASPPQPKATRLSPRAALQTPQHATPGPTDLTSNFTAEAYRAAIERAVEYIYAGDVFQVNLAQHLFYPAREETAALYRRLRERNPAPFAAYMDLGSCQLASASPERFLSVQEGRVETRPIKGTRPRTSAPEADLFAAEDLQSSEKDRAENIMIVDLLRNDLSRVCQPDSVQVTQLCHLEKYQYVQHLVSAVCGQLEPDRRPLDLIRAAFPGGSITGAPKIRAMEIIAELEGVARGPYCGSVGYLGFDGTLDLNILIRTITAQEGWWRFPVGGGIVAQSQPDGEYEETWHKAEGLLRSLS